MPSAEFVVNPSIVSMNLHVKSTCPEALTDCHNLARTGLGYNRKLGHAMSGPRRGVELNQQARVRKRLIRLESVRLFVERMPSAPYDAGVALFKTVETAKH